MARTRTLAKRAPKPPQKRATGRRASSSAGVDASSSAGLSGLNPAQRKVVETLSGPLLVIAGAGTGKTNTLVHRLAALVRSGVSPEDVVLLTFTRRAAAEMIERAGALCERPVAVRGGTFHSFALATLRRHGARVGLAAGFTVLDQGDVHDALGHVRADLSLGGKGSVGRGSVGMGPAAGGFPRSSTVAQLISRAVNEQVRLERVVKAEYSHLVPHTAALVRLAEGYRAYKQERGLVDFDDLLVKLVELLELASKRGLTLTPVRHLMVDEYQDTNLLQARITQLLSARAESVMVVGDDAQSIYGFRGANHRNLAEFEAAFPGAKVVTLEQNYRSGQAILDVGNAVLGQMRAAFRKRLFTSGGAGERPELIEAPDEETQASYVAAQIARLEREGTPRASIAVLFRTSHHALALELELGRRGVPYVKYGGFRFSEKAHVKDVLAHLRVLANPMDDAALTRALLLCEGVGPGGARQLAALLRGRPFDVDPRELPLRGKGKASVPALLEFLRELSKAQVTPGELLRRTVEHAAPALERSFDDWPLRQRDLEQLVRLTGRYRSLESMLSDLAIDPPTQARGENLAAEADGGQLVLSTIHSAKGLEWDAVFVIQALDGCLPHLADPWEEPSSDELDEELRLLYVAGTRARRRLTFVYPRATARGFGYGWASPSRFLARIPDELLDRGKASRGGSGAGSRRPRR